MSRFLPLLLVVPAVGCAARVDPVAEQRRQEAVAAEHDALMVDGLAALKADRHDDAIAAFEKAGRLLPGRP